MQWRSQTRRPRAVQLFLDQAELAVVVRRPAGTSTLLDSLPDTAERERAGPVFAEWIISEVSKKGVCHPGVTSSAHVSEVALVAKAGQLIMVKACQEREVGGADNLL